MQDTVIFLLLPSLALLLLVASRLRHASLTHKAAAYARLAAVKSSAVLKKLIPKLRQPEVYVSDRFAAHRLLVGGAATGGAFSDKPPSSVASAVLSRHRHYNINSAPYGSLWRAMRRNLTAEIFHPSRLRLFALGDLVADLERQCSSGDDGVVLAAESIRAAMFGLMSTMCFGGGVDGELVKAMADAQDDLVQCFLGLRVLSTFPAITGLIFRNRRRKLVELRRQQEEMYLPLIYARRRHDGEPPAYVDTLVDLSVPDEHGDRRRNKRRRRQQRKLTDGELVGLCSEFLGAGTEPAAAALQWIMANLVKRPDVQHALWKEIDAAVAADADEVGEEVLGRLDYLNAVIMEGLRLNPTVPVAFRQVMADDHVVLDGRRVPTGTAVLFPLARLSRDKTAWADPLEFRPERFMAGGEGEGVSFVAAAGSAGEIRMMPFGAGRRMCPGMGVAMLHLGYFVANLVREFEWVEVEGDHAVDLRPHVGFFRVMERPLHVRLVCRR
ncbi:hypothetical protein HU200_028642 [Digitaria exilis]|uniref:Cytochrome P450 n=1 Tax=Digitaria exilis TaxID=1010633 RepID=A0A835BVV3_9POAL|nr:hypothetical protein HU200_028642 [Digitaria exilis]CAB3482113.1 unnamed protein product [Digitaria exilis]